MLELILTLIFATLLVCIIILSALLVQYRADNKKLTKQYAPILEVEVYAINIRRNADIYALNLRKDADRQLSDAKMQVSNLKSIMEELRKRYEAGTTRFNELQKKINVLEESYDLLDFGLYKPHFAFNSSEQYRKAVERNYEEQKILIKNGMAMNAPQDWTVNGSRVEGKKMVNQTSKAMLRAFNGECDAAIAKVRWDNATKMEERIRNSFDAINKTGIVMKISITQAYLGCKLNELYLAFELAEKIQAEKEEQRRISETARDEERARKEAEKAQYEAEKEEERYQKALEKARNEIELLTGKQAEMMSQKIEDLERMLEEARAAKARAISQAQLTKSGHVYIISNIGSFGENVFKIGMTRRLEPFDRIRELGDASVPFPFDVHAMIYSEDAPSLENQLHKRFDQLSVNLINMRKEFFNVTIDDIEKWSIENNYQMKLTKIAEAKEYRESLKIRLEGNTEACVNKQEMAFVGSDHLFDES